MKHLIVFAKEPENGQIKTRLEGYLSKEQCKLLYEAFLMDTMNIAMDVKCDKRILAYTSTGDPIFIKDNFSNFELFEQLGQDLGERMFNAFSYAFASRAEKVVIIGSDSPTLPSKLIDEAFNKLDENDIVIGPTKDGGYYLIGFTSLFNGVFDNIEWSTSKVFEETLENIKKIGKSCFILKEWYDVDNHDDLAHLSQGDESLGMFTKDILDKTKKDQEKDV